MKSMPNMAGWLSPQKVDHLLRGAVSVYVLFIFTRWAEVSVVASWFGFIVWLLLADKKEWLTLGRNRLLLLWVAFLLWAFLVSLGSNQPSAALSGWFTSFSDHVLLAPLLIHLVLKEDFDRLLKIFAWAGCFIIFLNMLQYLGDYQKGEMGDPNLWFLHRKWGYPLVFFAPFILIQILLRERAARWFWGGLFVIGSVMVAGTGSRGAWLGYLSALLVFGGWLAWKRRLGLTLAILTIFTLAWIGYGLSPQGEILRQRLNQGLDTSYRLNGTWLPAIDMAMQHPWLGHGVGMAVYVDAYKRQARYFPHWHFGEKPIHPHNFFLMAFFSIGSVGLALTLALFYESLRAYLACLRYAITKEEGLLGLGLLASMVAYYFVRGSFETLSWHRWGIHLGIAAGLLQLSKIRFRIKQ